MTAMGATKEAKQTPEFFRNDPGAQAWMASREARQTANGCKGREVLIAETNHEWADKIEAAKWMDCYANANHGQASFDADFHLCHEQCYQQRDGFRIYEVGSWIGGGAVRDTHNDGDGTVFGGRVRRGATFAECLAWAREWHAADPARRRVVLGFWWDDELKRALTLAELTERPNFTGVRS